MGDNENSTLVVIERNDECINSIDIQVIGWFIENQYLRVIK